MRAHSKGRELKQQSKAGFLIALLSLLLPSPSFATPASSDVITFSTTTYASPYEVRLDFKVEVDVTLPSELSSGKSKDSSIDVRRGWATATLEHELFLPQETGFLTPLGDSDRIYVGNFLGELLYYIQLTNASVLMEISIEGNGTASPSSLLWSSSGSKSFTVSHTGSELSEDMFTLQLSFKYVGSLTVLSATLYGIISDKTVQKIELTGNQTLSQNIEVVPPEEFPVSPPPASSILLILLVVIAVVLGVIAVHMKKRKKDGKGGEVK